MLESNPIGVLNEWKQQNAPWRFSPVSFTSDGCFSEIYGARLMLTMLHLFMFSEGGAESHRGESLKCRPMFMFVSGFPSLSFPSYPQQQAASVSSTYTLPLSLSSVCLSVSIFSSHPFLPHLSTIQVCPKRTCPAFRFFLRRHRRPSIHLPTLTVPPVFVLQSGSWRGPSGHRREGKPVRWEELWGLEERAPVVQHGLLDFPSPSAETQTSEQALSGRSLCQMVMCDNTQIINLWRLFRL